MLSSVPGNWAFRSADPSASQSRGLDHLFFQQSHEGSALYTLLSLPFQYSSRIALFKILPLGFLGSSALNSTDFGFL